MPSHDPSARSSASRGSEGRDEGEGWRRGALLVGGIIIAGVALWIGRQGRQAAPHATFDIEAEMPRIDGLSPERSSSRLVSGSDMPLVQGLAPGPHGAVKIGPGWIRRHHAAGQALVGMLVCQADVVILSDINYRFSPWPDIDFTPTLVDGQGEPHAQYWAHDGDAGIALNGDDITRFSPWRQGALAWVADLESVLRRKVWFASVSAYAIDGELKSEGSAIFAYRESSLDVALIERAADKVGMGGSVERGFRARVGRWLRTIEVDRDDPKKTYVQVKTTDNVRGAAPSCQLNQARPAP